MANFVDANRKGLEFTMETSNNTHHPPAVQQQLQNALAASLDDDSSDDDIPTSHHLPACRRKKKGDKLNALKQGTIANLNGFDKASYGITSSSLRKGSVVHTKLKPGWEDRNDKKWKNSKLVKENYPLLNEKPDASTNHSRNIQLAYF